MNIAQRINIAYDYIRTLTDSTPEIGIILGSGLGEYADQLEHPLVIPFAEIPNFPVSTVAGHMGAFVFGKRNGKPVVAMRGRIHFYEGGSQGELTIPVRVMAKLGVKTLLLTSAAGAINTDLKPGDFLLVSDHINISGSNPLIGRNLSEFGPRFIDMSDLYTRRLRNRIKNLAAENEIKLAEGVYVMTSGPSYETPAEIRAYRALGGDVVGMSTVPEAIAARHCGMRVAAICCVTNMAAGLQEKALVYSDFLETAARVRGDFTRLMNLIIDIIQPIFFQ